MLFVEASLGVELALALSGVEFKGLFVGVALQIGARVAVKFTG